MCIYPSYNLITIIYSVYGFSDHFTNQRSHTETHMNNISLKCNDSINSLEIVLIFFLDVFDLSGRVGPSLQGEAILH